MKDTFDSRGVAHGRHHPANGAPTLARQAVERQEGGAIYRVQNCGSLSGGTFVRLVRDRWIASLGANTDELLTLLRPGSSGPLYLGVEEPASTLLQRNATG